MERCIGIRRFLDSIAECCGWWVKLPFHILVLSGLYLCPDTGCCDLGFVMVTFVPPRKLQGGTT